MKVAYFNATLKNGQDGVTRVLYKIFNSIKQRNIDAIAFGALLPSESHRIIPMVKVRSVKFPLHKAYPMALPDYNRVAKELDKFKPSIIHINSPCTLGYSAMRYAKRNNIPIVATYHTHFPTYLNYYRMYGLKEIVWKWMIKFYNNIDLTFVPTKEILTELQLRGIQNLCYLPHGIDTSDFNPAHYCEKWRESVGGQGKTILLFVSRLVWEKNIKVLADAYNILRCKRDDFTMVIIGEGHSKGELEKMMKGSYFLGYKEGKELYTAYASSDIFLFPSVTETFGLVTLEAMASATVPVAAKAGGAMGIIDDGINGLLTQPNNAEDMASKIEWLLNNSDVRLKMSQNAFSKAKHFDWEMILDELFLKYEEVIQMVNTYKYFKVA